MNFISILQGYLKNFPSDSYTRGVNVLCCCILTLCSSTDISCAYSLIGYYLFSKYFQSQEFIKGSPMFKNSLIWHFASCVCHSHQLASKFQNQLTIIQKRTI